MRLPQALLLVGVVASATARGDKTPIPATPPPAPARTPGATVPHNRYGGADTSYMESVHARVHDRWSGFLRELVRAPAPFQNQDLAVTLEVTVAADGTISEVKTQSGSGLAGFDEAPRELVTDLKRLPPPPDILRSDDDKAHLRWRFARQEPGCEEYELFEARLPLEEALERLIKAQRVTDAMARLDEARRSDVAVARAALPRLATLLGIPAASSADAPARAQAAHVLAYAASAEPLLLRLASDADKAVRVAALSALGRPPRSAAGRDLLLHALDGTDAEARAAGARALGELGDKTAAPRLLAALERGSAPFDAAWALGKLGEADKAVAAISTLLGGKGAARLSGALGAAGLADPRHGAKLLSSLSGASEEARLAMTDALGATGSQTSPEGRKALVKLLHDASPKVRARACAATLAIGDKSARARLIEAAVDPQPAVRAAAVAALVEAGGAAAVDELSHAAVDKAAPVRAALATALAAHPFEGSDKILGRLVDDKDDAVRLAAKAQTRAAAAGEAGDGLTRLVRARDPAARLSALVDALGGK